MPIPCWSTSVQQRVIEQTRIAIGKARQQGPSHFSIIEARSAMRPAP
jgi:hypothetical protein